MSRVGRNCYFSLFETSSIIIHDNDMLLYSLMQLSDGCLDLILVKKCPKLALLSLMSELSSGGHVKSPYVMYLKVSPSA